jgi:hypothetical protein
MFSFNFNKNVEKYKEENFKIYLNSLIVNGYIKKQKAN